MATRARPNPAESTKTTCDSNTDRESVRLESLTAVSLRLKGNVQGVGLRPWVARTANRLGVTGFVCNDLEGVLIHAEGTRQAVERFESEIRTPDHPCALGQPPLQQSPISIDIVESTPAAPRRDQEFLIAASDSRRAPIATRIPLDVAVCPRCLAETRDRRDRRHGYVFTTCTDCGPRYSLLRSMPFERDATAMRQFPLCPTCQSEFVTPTDRRYHAQTMACPDCGPQLWFCDAVGRQVGTADEAILAALALLREGKILAMRGVGGYQLLVDAGLQPAVARLRQRKGRPAKPFAVLVESIEAAQRLVELSKAERDQLQSPANPIVVSRPKRRGTIAPSVTADLNTIGVMLPSTPLHAIIADQFAAPLVCTSGNLDGEPLVADIEPAQTRLTGLADGWLHHNRQIERPIDDSVVRVIGGRTSTMRLARGLAPLTLPLETNGVTAVALGGHQKQSLAISNGAQAILGPHLGDLATEAARQRMDEQSRSLRHLFDVREDLRWACDLHPEYYTTTYAEQRTDNPCRVQHHFAHALAAALEHGLLDREVLAVTFDGSGYGDDETVWGGEFLLASPQGYRRVAHLRPFELPSGDLAVREPWRVATALVAASAPAQIRDLKFQSGNSAEIASILGTRFSPTTTSAGRLFDAAATLILGVEQSQFEGQPAMLLESACDETEMGAYAFPLASEKQKRSVLDWRPMIRQLLSDRRNHVAPAAMATRFHRGLARAIVAVASRYTVPVLLTGGVFQNQLLSELCLRYAEPRGVDLRIGGAIPVNDGGLAAGQLALALLEPTNQNQNAKKV